jgi:hypothetical protein
MCPPLADDAGIGHRLKHQAAALLRQREMLRRRQPRRRLDHPRKHRRLRKVQIFWVAPEVMVSGGAQPVDAVAEIDAG